MSIKWTMEAVWAAVAVCVTTAGGLYTTVYRSGASAAQVTAITVHQAEQDKTLGQHEDRIRTQETSAAAEQEALKDIKHQLDRIENKL